MQAIYRFADFTIVAASVIDSNAGLPGVRTPRKISQHVEKIHGLRLVTALPPLDHILETSRWNTRAWTFQESKLSRRLIVFSDGQVHFRCEGGEYCEDTRVESPRFKQTEYENPFQSMSLLHGAPQGRGFEIFQDLVSQYSLKHLSLPNDILNGFSGIINALRPFGAIGQNWRAGLPLDRLPRFERRSGSYNPVHDYYEGLRGEKFGVVGKFPSWSWIGWTGEIGYLNKPPGSIKKDCKASAGHYLLNINARKLSFNVRRSTKADIALTNFSVYDILNSNRKIISNFIQDHSLIPSTKPDEARKYELLLLVTLSPKYAKSPVRPRQWKPSSRFVATALPMGGKPPREAHDGPFLNTIMIIRPDTYPEKPAERVALVYIPQKYWDVEGVVREDVVIG
ncbi:hypothetical protein BDZ45DRAFT_743903 [Acephala macrosclerotiorum]|nr:hypothetical protein BDZ45DRAFT_743903 [Acephala macrosclerotiorum]